jgi:CheY-like chemotaxis protein
MMPGKDGLETMEEIRAWERSRRKERTPVIAMTANAITGTRDLLIAKGFNDYISKPINFGRLNALIEKWIPPEKIRR